MRCGMESTNYKYFDIDLLQEKESVIVSSEYALKDVIPIKWSNDVISGNKKVLLIAKSDSSCVAK